MKRQRSKTHVSTVQRSQLRDNVNAASERVDVRTGTRARTMNLTRSLFHAETHVMTHALHDNSHVHYMFNVARTSLSPRGGTCYVTLRPSTLAHGATRTQPHLEHEAIPHVPSTANAAADRWLQRRACDSMAPLNPQPTDSCPAAADLPHQRLHRLMCRRAMSPTAKLHYSRPCLFRSCGHAFALSPLALGEKRRCNEPSPASSNASST